MKLLLDIDSCNARVFMMRSCSFFEISIVTSYKLDVQELKSEKGSMKVPKNAGLNPPKCVTRNQPTDRYCFVHLAKWLQKISDSLEFLII